MDGLEAQIVFLLQFHWSFCELIETVCWLSPEKTLWNTESRSFHRTIPKCESAVSDVFEEDFDLISRHTREQDRAVLLSSRS